MLGDVVIKKRGHVGSMLGPYKGFIWLFQLNFCFYAIKDPIIVLCHLYFLDHILAIIWPCFWLFLLYLIFCRSEIA